MGLNESYTSVRGNILMMTPLPTLSQIYSLLTQEERQRQVKQGSYFQAESASFNASTNSSLDARPYPGKKIKGKKSQLFCEHYKRNNHTVDKCYKLHGYPNSRPGARNRSTRAANHAWGEQFNDKDPSEVAVPSLPGLSQEQSKQLMQFLTTLTAGNDQRTSPKESTGSAAHMAGTMYALSAVNCFCSLSHGSWILDSGASDHICSDKTFLHDLSVLSVPVMVKLPNGTHVQVTQQGKLHITQGFVLEHVLVIPHFQ